MTPQPGRAGRMAISADSDFMARALDLAQRGLYTTTPNPRVGCVIVRNGFLRALHKRPVPTEFVDQAVDRIVGQVLALGEREVASRRIGEMVMQELYKLDKVAYIRFASVYKSFQDVDDFQDAIKEVQRPSGRK